MTINDLQLLTFYCLIYQIAIDSFYKCISVQMLFVWCITAKGSINYFDNTIDNYNDILLVFLAILKKAKIIPNNLFWKKVATYPKLRISTI